MTVDLRHNVVAGPEHGFQDILARPDLDTLVPRAVGAGHRLVPGRPLPHGRLAVRGRSARRRCARAVEGYAELGLIADRRPGARVLPVRARPGRAASATAATSTTRATSTRSAHVADPRGVLHDDAARVRRHGARRDRRQPRVRPQPVRDQPHATARRSTPPTARSASSRWSRTWPRARACWRRSSASPGTTTRARASTCTSRSATRTGTNALNGDGEDGLSPMARHLIAGLLEHGAGADGVLQPDHERLPAPASRGARADARQLGPRQPPDAGPRARASAAARPGSSSGVGDGAANPYLAIAAALFAGLDGIRRELEPPAPGRRA